MTFDGVLRTEYRRYNFGLVKRKAEATSSQAPAQAQPEPENRVPILCLVVPLLLPTPSHLLLLLLQAAQQTSLSTSTLPSLESSLAVIKAHPYCRIPTANHACATSAHIAPLNPLHSHTASACHTYRRIASKFLPTQHPPAVLCPLTLNFRNRPTPIGPFNIRFWEPW